MASRCRRVDEFKQAMGRKVPALNMLGDLPPQGAPITVPGGEAPGQPPQPTGPRPPMGAGTTRRVAWHHR